MKDTDGDGFDDYTELEEGYDPLNPDSHPSKGGLLSTLLLIIALLALLGAGGYLGYTELYKKKQKPKRMMPGRIQPTVTKPLPQKALTTKPTVPATKKPELLKAKLKSIRAERKKQMLEESKKIGDAFTAKKPKPKTESPVKKPQDEYLTLDKLKKKPKPKDVLGSLSGLVKDKYVFEELKKASDKKIVTKKTVTKNKQKVKKQKPKVQKKQPKQESKKSSEDVLKSLDKESKKKSKGEDYYNV